MQEQLRNFESNSQHTKKEIATILQYALELRIEFLKRNVREKYHSLYGKPKEIELIEAVAYKITKLVDSADSLVNEINEVSLHIVKYLEEYEDDKRDVTEGNDSTPI